MATNHTEEQNIAVTEGAAFELDSEEGSINNNHSGATSLRLPISSRDFYSEPLGTKTPPLGSLCSVPFKWEEIPGKAKQRVMDDQLISSYEAPDGLGLWDYGDDQHQLFGFKVGGDSGFQDEERLVVQNHMMTESRKRCRGRRAVEKSTEFLAEMWGRFRSAMDSASRV